MSSTVPPLPIGPHKLVPLLSPRVSSAPKSSRSTSTPRSARSQSHHNLNAVSKRESSVDKLRSLAPEFARSISVHSSKDVAALLNSSEITSLIGASMSVLRDLYRTKSILLFTDPSLDAMKGFDNTEDLVLGDIPNVPHELAREKGTFQELLAEIESSQASVPVGMFQSEVWGLKKVEQAFSELEGRLEKSQNVIRKLFAQNRDLQEENKLLRTSLRKRKTNDNDPLQDQDHQTPISPASRTDSDKIAVASDLSIEDLIAELNKPADPNPTSTLFMEAKASGNNDEMENLKRRLAELEGELVLCKTCSLDKFNVLMSQRLRGTSEDHETVKEIHAACVQLVPRMHDLIKEVASLRLQNQILLGSRQSHKAEIKDLLRRFLIERDRLIFRAYSLLKAVHGRLSDPVHSSSSKMPENMHPQVAANRVLHDIEASINAQLKSSSEHLERSVLHLVSDVKATADPDDVDDAVTRLSGIGSKVAHLAANLTLPDRKALTEVLTELAHRFRMTNLHLKVLQNHAVQQQEARMNEVDAWERERSLLHETCEQLISIVGSQPQSNSTNNNGSSRLAPPSKASTWLRWMVDRTDAQFASNPLNTDVVSRIESPTNLDLDLYEDDFE
eukprot:ANDGO_02288.mRNA.1 hypothetical protein